MLVRSDGRPTYNFVSPLEDVLDGITHVIRGQDHVSNTPKQMQHPRGARRRAARSTRTCRSLNGHRRQKLSKRHGAVTVEDFRADGLPRPRRW